MPDRSEILHQIARNYVDSLGKGNFDSIPYSEDVQLRAPLCPGGSANPVTGKSTLQEQWWAPLPDLVSGVELIDSFTNSDLTAVTVEFHCEIESMSCTLRIIDRFKVDSEGMIVSQENFFDPRDVTNPDWQDG